MSRETVRHSTTDVQVLAVRPDHHLLRPDRLATEEPMEIRASGPGQDPSPVAVTMRTPGHDFELAAGFLITEGLVADPSTITTVRYCELEPGADQEYNVVTVRLKHAWDPACVSRRLTVTSSCGTCGKATLDQVEVACPRVAAGPPLPRSVITGLPDRLRAGQSLFDATGGLHAAGLFDATGSLVAVREDVGRHNAVDKVAGYAALGGRLPLRDHLLMVSGRVSFEIVQKAAMAGIGMVCAVSAPSSLAVAAAERLGVSVVGFLRGDTFNVYSHPERIDLA